MNTPRPDPFAISRSAAELGPASAVVELEPTTASTRAARQHTADFLSDQHRRDLLPDVSLIVTELVTNAVLHGRPPIRLSCAMNPFLLVAVFDSDPRTERVQVQRLNRGKSGGRGLHIVETIADRWGTLAHPNGKTVWAELARPFPHLPTSGHPFG